MAQDAQTTGHAAEPDQPVASGERIATLDFVRGIAVLGILFANITAFAQPYYAYFWPPALIGGMEEGDKWVWMVQFILIDGKLRGLFTLLFGAGVMLFLERAAARGSGRGLQLRRLAWLLLFGLIHFFLIWRGDILTLYAVWGMVLLLMVKWRPFIQLVVGLCLAGFGALALGVLMGGQYAASVLPSLQANMGPEELAMVLGAADKTLADSVKELALYAHGSWFEIARATIAERGGELLQEVLIVGPAETLGLMLIGMALYRLGFFSGTFDPARMRKWGWIGVIGGVLVSIPAALWVYAGGFEFYRTLFVFNGLGGVLHLPMVIGLAALLVVWAPRAVATRLGARFVAAGRMAFSNYLGTSIVMVVLFQGWGLGLFGQLHRIELLGIVALAWIAMLMWSPWWLARFNYGPLEWLWRCLTYWHLFPFKRTVRV
jgi:uncharacterized protein